MCDFILHKIFKHIEITQEEFSFQIPFLDKMLTGCLEFEVNNKNRYPTETFIYWVLYKFILIFPAILVKLSQFNSCSGLSTFLKSGIQLYSGTLYS